MHLHMAAGQQIGFAALVNKLARNNGRVLLCPANYMNLCSGLFIQCKRKRSIVVLNAALEARARSKTNDNPW